MLGKFTTGLAAAALLLGLTGCTGSGQVTFTWSGSASVDFGGGVTGGGTGTTEQKKIEVNVTINPGNGTIDGADLESTITMRQRWQTTVTVFSGGDPTTMAAGDFDASLVYSPIYAELNSSTGMIDARFVVTLQYGWNGFLVEGTINACDSKGNCDPRTLNETETFVYGDFGDVIPMKVALEWGAYGADLDLLVHEQDALGTYSNWIYWDNMGYNANTNGCYGETDIISCYQGSYYVVGEDRLGGISYGSLDKDDIVRGGPEVYTVDPIGALLPDGVTNIAPIAWADGHTFTVYVAYFEDDSALQGQNGQTAVGVTSIYLLGSATPTCLKTTSISQDKIEPALTAMNADGSPGATRLGEIDAAYAAAVAAGQLQEMGTLTYDTTATAEWTWVDGPDSITATETGGFCIE